MPGLTLAAKVPRRTGQRLIDAAVDTAFGDSQRCAISRTGHPSCGRRPECFSRWGGAVVLSKAPETPGRSTQHMLNSVKDLETRGIGFESLHDKVDTTSAQGRLWFHFMGRHERVQADLVRERINAGLASAKARGQRLGPPTVM
jgi:hypothetical protein